MNDTITGVWSEKINYIRGQKKKHGKKVLYVREERTDINGAVKTKWHGPYANKRTQDEALVRLRHDVAFAPPATTITLRQALDEFIILNKDFEGAGYIDNKKRAVQLFHNTLHLHDIALDQIATTHVATFVKQLKLAGKSNDTIRRTLWHLQVIYIEQTPEHGIQPRNIFTTAPYKLKIDPKERYALYLEEIEEMFKHMSYDEWPYRYAFRLMCETGLRPGELAAIRYGDIDFEKRSIDIKHSLQLADNYRGLESGLWRWKELKPGKKAERTVYLWKQAWHWLEQHMQEDAKLRDTYNGNFSTKYKLSLPGNVQGYPHYKQMLQKHVEEKYVDNVRKKENGPVQQTVFTDAFMISVDKADEYNQLVFTRMPFDEYKKIHRVQKCETMGWPLDTNVCFNNELKYYAKKANVEYTITKYNLRHTAFANMVRVHGMTLDQLITYTVHADQRTLLKYVRKFSDRENEQRNIRSFMDNAWTQRA